jgi:tetratricopeptide (TPR) repeat protein
MEDELVSQAKAALADGDPERARALADRAYAAHPDDAGALEVYSVLHLAQAIRLSAAAREARRKSIVARGIRYDEEFSDDADVERAFDEAARAIDAVLAADPSNEKALMMKAALLFRRDRVTGRPASLEILRRIAQTNPENRQVLLAIRKVERPCARCSDSGFCPRCRGRGSRRILGFESKCESCHGQGICLACGVL